MKAIRPPLPLVIVFALAGIAFFAIWRGNVQPPVTLLLISTSNDSRGSQTSYFCMSNQSTRPVVFLGDANGLPSYLLTESLTLNPTNRTFLLTNYNQEQLFTSRQAALPPRGSVIFPVRVPSAATKAILQVNYLGQKSTLEAWTRSWYQRVTGHSSEAYQSLRIGQPFTKTLKQ